MDVSYRSSRLKPLFTPKWVAASEPGTKVVKCSVTKIAMVPEGKRPENN